MSARDVIADWLHDASIQNGFENSRGKSVNDHADTILLALEAAGYVVVPKEPTGKMQIAGGKAQQQCIGSWGEPAIVWKAMLAAAKESK